MDEQRIRQIIKEELSELIKSDRFTFYKTLQILDGRNIQLGLGTGTQIGTASAQKLGFYGVTPVNQPNTIPDPTGQANDLDSEARTGVNDIIDRLQEVGIIK